MSTPQQVFPPGTSLRLSQKERGSFWGWTFSAPLREKRFHMQGKSHLGLGSLGHWWNITAPGEGTALPKLCLHLQRTASWPRSMTEEGRGWERKALLLEKQKHLWESYKRQTLHGEQHKGKIQSQQEQQSHQGLKSHGPIATTNLIGNYSNNRL